MEVFVARQPIFDTQDERIGYELLYRHSAERNWAEGTTQEQMSADVLVNSLLTIGLEQLTGGTLAFLNISRDMLLAGNAELLDAGKVVIELLESVRPDAEVLAACQRLTDRGYHLALDDFVYDRQWEPILSHVSILKIDVLERPTEEIAEVVEQLAHFGGKLLAERVETREVRDRCRALGFELFQGYFYSRPEILSKHEVSVEQAAIMRLMNLLRSEQATEANIEEAFRSDPGLSYRLLRMVNAAALGGRGIDSIRQALRLLGRDTLFRWMALLLVSSVAAAGGTDAELVRSAILRAHLCEQLAEAGGREEASGPLFLVGLLSRIDVLLRIPMDEIVGLLDLAPEVQDALLRRSGSYAGWLKLVEAYEDGRWDTVPELSGRIGMPPTRVAQLYVQSLSWARAQLNAGA